MVSIDPAKETFGCCRGLQFETAGIQGSALYELGQVKWPQATRGFPTGMLAQLLQDPCPCCREGAAAASTCLAWHSTCTQVDYSASTSRCCATVMHHGCSMNAQALRGESVIFACRRQNHHLASPSARPTEVCSHFRQIVGVHLRLPTNSTVPPSFF